MGLSCLCRCQAKERILSFHWLETNELAGVRKGKVSQVYQFSLAFVAFDTKVYRPKNSERTAAMVQGEQGIMREQCVEEGYKTEIRDSGKWGKQKPGQQRMVIQRKESPGWLCL